MDDRYDTHYDQVPSPDIEPEKLPPYFRTDINISSKWTKHFETIIDIRNLFNLNNEVGAVWGNRNREGHQEEGLSILVTLKISTWGLLLLCDNEPGR